MTAADNLTLIWVSFIRENTTLREQGVLSRPSYPTRRAEMINAIRIMRRVNEVLTKNVRNMPLANEITIAKNYIPANFSVINFFYLSQISRYK